MMSTTQVGTPRSVGLSLERLEIPELKFRLPTPQPGMVTRDRLVDRLREAYDARLITIVAPTGYGKSVLMTQWIEREIRPTAWLSLDHSDNDPASLISDIATALGLAGLLRSDGVQALHFTSDSAISHGIPRLIRALDPDAGPGILQLDNLDALRKRAAIDAIGTLVYQVEGRIQVAIASRSEGRIPVASLRPQGAVLELTAEDLALDEREAAFLLDATGVRSEYDLDAVMEKTEGWPVGVYLTGLAIQAGSAGSEALSVGGDDLYIAEYLRHKILDRLSDTRVSFLTRTSILDQLSGPLCDYVLETTASARTLEDLERSNLLIMRLDRTREWHRYHHMFQDLLRAELKLREPEAAAGLHERAAEWFEANDMPEIAIGHAQAAGDVERVAGLVGAIGRSVYARGRSDTLLDWLEWLERSGDIRRNTEIAAFGALACALTGDPIGVERWTIPGEPTTPIARMARAIQTRAGTGAMIEDARTALEELPPGSGFRAAATLMEGLGWLWEGEVERADALFAEAVTLGESQGAIPTATMALAERAVIAIEAGDWSIGEQWANQSLRLVLDNGLEGYATSALVFVVAARLARRRNDISKASALLAQAASLRPRLNTTQPGIAVQTCTKMAEAYLELSDIAGARRVIQAARDTLAQRPDLGQLPQRLEQVLAGVTAPGKVGPSALTTAELRLLPLLATHLTFPEIGERLYISRHTVKTQAISIYRKLGASSRSEAVEAARQSGLLGA